MSKFHPADYRPR